MKRKKKLSKRIRAQYMCVRLKFSDTCNINYTTNSKFSCSLVVIIIDKMLKCGSVVFNLCARLYYIVTRVLSSWYLLELSSEKRHSQSSISFNVFLIEIRSDAYDEYHVGTNKLNLRYWTNITHTVILTFFVVYLYSKRV